MFSAREHARLPSNIRQLEYLPGYSPDDEEGSNTAPLRCCLHLRVPRTHRRSMHAVLNRGGSNGADRKRGIGAARAVGWMWHASALQD
eukprot:6788038-Alexandrium_andersonii.AAC.1